MLYVCYQNVIRPQCTDVLYCNPCFHFPHCPCVIHAVQGENEQHYSDVIMGAMASQTIGVSIVCLTVGSSVHQRKHQSTASQAFVRRIPWWPEDSPHKGPVTREMFPFDDVIMSTPRIVTCTPILHHLHWQKSTPLGFWWEFLFRWECGGWWLIIDTIITLSPINATVAHHRYKKNNNSRHICYAIIIDQEK